MSDPTVDFVEWREDSDSAALLDRLLAPDAADYALLSRPGLTVPADVVARLVDACNAPMAATASPVPSGSAPGNEVVSVGVHERLPAPASIAIPCLDACLISREAIRSASPPCIPTDATPSQAIVALCCRLVDVGWRHVAAPGAALDWKPPELGDVRGGWSEGVVSELTGPANEGLSTHRLWTDYTLRGPRVLVDGACLTDHPNNGSQKVVVNVTRWLRHVRSNASISLAVHDQYVGYFRDQLSDTGVAVIPRRAVAPRFDLVYRPYQLIDPADAVWLFDTGDRLLLGQLDMIGFSNPSYHPSSSLLHAVRNLQRRMLRLADGVAFISGFGRAVALAECPDLEEGRLFVVSCGTESAPLKHPARPPLLDDISEFLFCLSASFWHKNRQHALRVFAQLCERHGFQGSLVIAGPEPYYGRSGEAEQRVLDSMPPDVAVRVVRLGQVDEPTKWWLLSRARLVLYPSVVEGFGLVPFEAAAVGTPTLVFAGSGLAELLDEAPCMVATWRLDEWTSMAHDLITSSERSAAAVESIERAALSHTWKQVAEHTWDAIDATIASPRARPRGDEGGFSSRITPSGGGLAAGSRAMHFANRLMALVKRRVHRLR